MLLGTNHLSLTDRNYASEAQHELLIKLVNRILDLID